MRLIRLRNNSRFESWMNIKFPPTWWWGQCAILFTGFYILNVTPISFDLTPLNILEANYNMIWIPAMIWVLGGFLKVIRTWKVDEDE